MRNLKKSLSLLLALVMVLSVMSVGAFATDETLVSTGDALKTAVEAGGAIKLEADITTVPIAIKNGQTVTIDLNGYNIACETSGSNKYSKGVFVIDNGRLELTGTGKVYETKDDCYSAVMLYGSPDPEAEDYSVLTVGENVTLAGWSGIFINRVDGNNHAYGVVVNLNGTAQNPGMEGHSAAGYGIYVNGSIQDKTGNVPQFTIGENAKVISLNYAIYAGGYANWSISGGTFTGGIEAKAGTFTMSGVTVNAQGTLSHSENNNGTSTSGYAVAVVKNGGYAGEPIVNINGGTFNGEVAMLEDNQNNYDGQLNITGGTFSDFSALDYLGENANVTIKLTDDVTLSSKLEIDAPGKSVTLDLGDNTLTGRTNLKAGNLTIQNGNIVCMNDQPLNVYGSATSAENYSVLTIADDVIVTGGNFGVCMFGPTASAKIGYGAVINLAGTVNTTGSGTEGAIFVSGNLGNYVNEGFNNNVINITGTITSQNDTPLALNGLAQVNIEDGAVLTGNTAVAVKRGFLNVNGGTLTSNGAKYDPPAVNNNGTEMSGAGISMTNTYNQYGPMAVNVSGGTIISAYADAIYKQDATYANDATITITGGTFSSDVSDYVAPGYKSVANGSGNYVVSPKATEATSTDTNSTTYAVTDAAETTNTANSTKTTSAVVATPSTTFSENKAVTFTAKTQNAEELKATVTFDSTAVSTIKTNAGDSDVTLNVAVTEPTNSDTTVRVSITLQDKDGNNLYKEGEAAGTATITVPFTGTNPVVYLVENEKHVGDPITATNNDDGTATFTVAHFSDYDVVEDEEQSSETEEEFTPEFVGATVSASAYNVIWSPVLSLDSNIHYIMHVHFTPSVLEKLNYEDEDTYVSFTYNGVETKLKLNDLTQNENDQWYDYTQEVVAKDMDASIEIAIVVDGVVDTTTLEYVSINGSSGNGYYTTDNGKVTTSVNTVLRNMKATYSETTYSYKLADAMIKYGEAAKAYFDAKNASN